MPSNLNKLFELAICICLSGLLAGCANLLPEPYKIDIYQGNNLKIELIDELEIGMTKEQVIFLLGTPVVKHVFEAERWDYSYYKSTAGFFKAPRSLRVFFRQGLVSDFELVKPDSNALISAE